MDVTRLIEGQRVMAILRNMDVTRTVRLSIQAWDLGITLVEVPIQTPEALPALEAALAAARERGLSVGAGTVTTVDQVRLCARLGVAFTVAPGLDPDVVRESAATGVPHIPGVATASEIQRALRLGCTILKAFPASVLGIGWFKAMRGPFPHLPLVATGGMDAHNATDFLAAGANIVAVGTALEDEQQLPLLAELAAVPGTV
jgi:2-dehydro-3-deoxyphosphogluconate aldolase / (4S)-4-hydroxy-2-oxoglutarate aldolase